MFVGTIDITVYLAVRYSVIHMMSTHIHKTKDSYKYGC